MMGVSTVPARRRHVVADDRFLVALSSIGLGGSPSRFASVVPATNGNLIWHQDAPEELLAILVTGHFSEPDGLDRGADAEIADHLRCDLARARDDFSHREPAHATLARPHPAASEGFGLIRP